jgi:hypothetical protein
MVSNCATAEETLRHNFLRFGGDKLASEVHVVFSGCGA